MISSISAVSGVIIGVVIAVVVIFLLSLIHISEPTRPY